MNRSSFLLLISSCFLAILPLRGHLGVLAEIVVYILLAWRVVGTVRQDFMPKGYAMQIVAIAAVVAALVVGAAGNGVTLGAIMTALCVALPLKLFETEKSRDFTIIYSFTLLLIGVDLCYQRDALTWGLCIGSFALLITAMVSQQQAGQPVAKSAVVSAKILLLIVPIAAFFCVLLPTDEMSKWAMFAGGEQAKTGMSDSMAPGDVSNLVMSEDLAFSGRFTNARPDPDSLYWRAIVLDRFDGAKWIASGSSTANLHVGEDELNAGALKYELVLEPTIGPWVPIAGQVLNIQSRAVDDQVLINPETLEVRREAPANIASKFAVTIGSPLSAKLNAPSGTLDYLQLPSGNPKTKAFASKLRAQSTGESEFVARILHKFNDEEYIYTVSPKKLVGINRVDDFLFKTKEGFCEHYASAFVVALRSGGVPSRVVTGYQGASSFDLSSGKFEVRQSEAHAWAEYWTPKTGWIRVDPTASVHPSRVKAKPTKSKFASVFSNAIRIMGVAPSFFSLRGSEIAAGLNRDSANEDPSGATRGVTQRNERASRTLRASVAGVVIATLVFFLFLNRKLRRHNEQNPRNLMMNEMKVIIEVLGFKRRQSETLRELAGRIVGDGAPSELCLLRDYVLRCEALLYGPRDMRSADVKELQGMVSDIKKNSRLAPRIRINVRIAIGKFR